MDDQTLRRDLLTAFEYSYLHDDWVNPLSETLDGVTVAEALWKPGTSPQPSPPGRGQSKCIWEIVLHMANWTENIVERMRGDRKARPADGPWPAVPAVVDEGAWADAQSRLWRSLDVLRAEMQTVSMAVLMEEPWEDGSVLADLFCRFTHNAYHIGQITKMRECMAAK